MACGLAIAGRESRLLLLDVGKQDFGLGELLLGLLNDMLRRVFNVSFVHEAALKLAYGGFGGVALGGKFVEIFLGGLGVDVEPAVIFCLRQAHAGLAAGNCDDGFEFAELPDELGICFEKRLVSKAQTYVFGRDFQAFSDKASFGDDGFYGFELLA